MLSKDTHLEEKLPHVKTIVVVEDDTSIGDLLVALLDEEEHFHTVHVTDGMKALKIVQSIKPDLFVLDYILPVMNGIELYDKIRAIPEISDVPALFMSANAPIDEIEKRHASYIKKPFDLDDLFKMVHTLLAEHD